MDNQQRPASQPPEPSGGANTKKAECKPPFKVLPNKSGFAPGVTADNLKDVFHELEDEEFLEKLNR